MPFLTIAKFFVNLRGWKGIQTDGRWCHRVILKGITKIIVILYTMLLMYLKGLDTLEATLHTHSLTIKIIKIIHFVFVYYNSLYLNMFKYQIFLVVTKYLRNDWSYWFMLFRELS